MWKSIATNAVLFLISIAVALGAGELVMRLKNRSMQNYDIEMWRYAKELKTLSAEPKIGHEHLPSKSAVLQSVTIRTNQYGLRGGDIAPARGERRRILFLGSSITLGWGVREEDTVTARIEKKFREQKADVEVLNAGVGNYNAPRYVGLFMNRLKELQPTDIVVHYFLRDAEVLGIDTGNALLRNSELAITLWIAAGQAFRSTKDDAQLEHYRTVYDPKSPGFGDMKAALEELSDYAQKNNIRVYLAMIPDVHDLAKYRFNFVHETMKGISKELKFEYIDLLPSMKDLVPATLWAMPGDPHPNALGHQRMADAIFPVLWRDQPAR